MKSLAIMRQVFFQPAWPFYVNMKATAVICMLSVRKTVCQEASFLPVMDVY
jgi:hypothetical protein